MSKKPLDASKIYIIFGLIFIAIIGIRTISTPEIWSHLAQGRANAPLSFLASDSVVNTTHLYDKVLYGLWSIGGASLLIITNVIGLLAAFWLLIQASKKWGGGLSQGLALLVSGHLIFQNMDVSPQTMMMLFIALFLYVLTTVKKTALLFGVLIPLQILWANTHGSFLFGPFLVGLAAIEAGQNAKRAGRKKQYGVPMEVLGGLSAALLVATLVNPYFLKLHAQVFANVQMSYPAYWASLFAEYFQTPSRDPLIFFVLILGAGGLITLKKRLPVLFTTLAIIGSLLVIRSVYTVQLFTVLAFPFMVLSFTAVGEYLSSSFKTLLGKRENLMAPIATAVFALLVIFSMIPIVSNCAYTQFGSASSFGFGVEEQLYPADLEALIGHPAFPDIALNLAADGGYLAFQYDRKIFIDYRHGRYDRQLLEDLQSMLLGNSKAYDTLFETYRPEAIIINTLHRDAAQGLVTLLARQIWKLAYFDGTTALLLLDKAEFAPLLSDTQAQAAGLAKLELARATYAEKLRKGCWAGNPAELIGSGKIFLAFNRPNESKAIFSLLLEGNDSISSSWMGLGVSQLMLKEFDAAETSLRTSTELAPNNVMAWVNYARACAQTGNTEGKERALGMAREIAEQNQRDAPAEEEDPIEQVETKSLSLEDLQAPE